MDLYKLKAFYTVAKLGSFSRAAETLFLTQPAVSARIKELESEYETRLFDRVGRNIQLTHAGEALLPYVKTILDTYEESIFAVGLLRDAGRGTIRLGVSELPGARVVPSCLATFQKRFPEITFSITTEKSRVILDLLRKNRVDIGIIGSSEKSLRSELVSAILFEDETFVAVSPKNPLAGKKVISVEELASVPLIVSLKNTVSRQALDRLFHRYSIPYNVAYEIGNKEMIKTMVENDLGVAFFSHMEIKKEFESSWVTILRIKGSPLLRYILAVYPQSRELNPSVKAFYDFLSECRPAMPIATEEDLVSLTGSGEEVVQQGL